MDRVAGMSASHADSLNMFRLPPARNGRSPFYGQLRLCRLGIRSFDHILRLWRKGVAHGYHGEGDGWSSVEVHRRGERVCKEA